MAKLKLKNKLENKILSVLLAAKEGEPGSAWLTSSALLEKVGHGKLGAPFPPEILQVVTDLSSQGLIEFMPVHSQGKIVAFIVKISRRGINMLKYGVPSLIGR